MTVSACVPAFNNEATIRESILSLLGQTIKPEEIFLVDDGSTDKTAAIAREMGIRVVSLGQNKGRGTARAAAIDHCRSDLLLSVDGTAALAPDFLEKALEHMKESKVAAVFGSIHGKEEKTTADRWRARHLYRQEGDEPKKAGHLITGGCLLRVEAIRACGNFNPDLRHSEDAEMGERLLDGQWEIVYEPQAKVFTLISNNVGQVLERYWRWNFGPARSFSLQSHLRFAWYVMRLLITRDLRAKDFLSAGITSLLPAYCGWRSIKEMRRSVQYRARLSDNPIK